MSRDMKTLYIFSCKKTASYRSKSVGANCSQVVSEVSCASLTHFLLPGPLEEPMSMSECAVYRRRHTDTFTRLLLHISGAVLLLLLHTAC